MRPNAGKFKWGVTPILKQGFRWRHAAPRHQTSDAGGFKYHGSVTTCSTMPLRLFLLRALLLFVVAAKIAAAQSLPATVDLALTRAHIPLSSVAAYVQDVDGSTPL